MNELFQSKDFRSLWFKKANNHVGTKISDLPPSMYLTLLKTFSIWNKGSVVERKPRTFPEENI